ncbi:hypothetical protein LTSEMIS_2801, partial [Salmonella enterica subsp. enterica serovar Mississippi str. A4-633]
PDTPLTRITARKLTSMIQQLKAMSEKVSKTYSANLDNLF